MSLEKFKGILRSQFAQNPRHCSVCKQTRPRDGGKEIVLQGGLRHRWVCAKCGATHAKV